ncbi:MAG: transketolase, partial [Candidatus Cloacimonas sp. 4484_275]
MNLEKKQLTFEELEKIKKSANMARGAILQMTTLAKSGHPGGSMSTIDFLLTLYHLINIDPKNPLWEKRDRVIVSNGHISPALYATLGMMGFFNLDEAISQFRLAGSIFEGHIEPSVPGVEWATGNLGQGLSAGIGFADLANVTAFIDYNKLQISGNIAKVMPQNIKDNYISDGWTVIEIDGHDFAQIQNAIFEAVKGWTVIEIDGHDFAQIQNAIFEAVKTPNPTLILANTIMGKGVSFMENKEKYHGSVLSEEQLNQALSELGLANNLEKYKKMRENFKPLPNSGKSDKDFSLKTGKSIIYSEKTDNRSAWGNAIADIAVLNSTEENKKLLAVFDCDLQGSVKTNSFEKNLPENFYESGIMEHHTAVMSGAMSKDGIQVFFADFGVFGIDETYNQHRLNDINETNLKVITTHVGLDVGEDGKTHQCIDYLGVMKNLYHFKILVPADANQTDHIIRYVAGKRGNYLVAMGRSKLEIIKDENGKIFFDENYRFEFGKADLLRDGTNAALLTMGTLTGRALEIAKILSEQGISLQVWNFSAPTELDEEALKKAAQTGTIFTYED